MLIRHLEEIERAPAFDILNKLKPVFWYPLEKRSGVGALMIALQSSPIITRERDVD